MFLFRFLVDYSLQNLTPPAEINRPMAHEIVGQLVDTSNQL